MQIVAGTQNVGGLGAVVHAAGGVAQVLLDTTDATVRVLVNNLAETSDTRTSRQALGRYTLHSLVQLADGEVGMLLHIGADAAQLLMSSVPPRAVTATLCALNTAVSRARLQARHGCTGACQGGYALVLGRFKPVRLAP